MLRTATLPFRATVALVLTAAMGCAGDDGASQDTTGDASATMTSAPSTSSPPTTSTSGSSSSAASTSGSTSSSGTDSSSSGTDAGESSSSTGPGLPDPAGVLHVVTLEFGPAFDPEAGFEQLDEHNAEIAMRFEDGELLANALRADGPGFYLYDRDFVDPDELIETDPAIQDDLLAVASTEDWILFIEAMGTELDDGEFTFILDYGLGPNAVDGAAFVEQDIAEHSAYFGGLFAEGDVLAGGIIGDDRARYIVVADDQDDAEAIAAADPGVAAGVLEAAAVQWGNPAPFPPYFHRRSLADTQAAQE